MLFIYYILMLILSSFFMMFGISFFNDNNLLYLDWLILNYSSIKFSFIIYLDYMSLMFIGMVLLISSMVMLYSLNYMKMEINLKRFNYLLMLFILSMIFMIISPNILSILLGWDMLGLTSYCLVIFYQSKLALNSGMLTILLNRIGDIGLLMLICLSIMYGSFNLFIYEMNFKMIMIIFLILSSSTKSAQIPFCSWLPAAMMAPTPISSLVHSSTLVTAGVYLLIRYHILLLESELNYFILLISSLTMFMSGLIANFEYDFKKIIALSTLSQLGLMISILSLNLTSLSFFHLIIHALFKSLMFMSVGGFIHLINTQDIRKYGGIMILLPMYSLMFLISSLCLCGFPFLAGFYSKDLIMEILFMSKLSFISFMLLILATIFTVSYTIRLILYIMYGETNFLNIKFILESMIMIFSMSPLSLILIIIGKYMLKLMYYYLIMLNLYFKLLMFFLILIGMILGFMFYKMDLIKLNFIGLFFSSMFYLNYFYKISYINMLKSIINYEKIIELGYMENMFSLFIYKLMFYNKKLLNVNVFNVLILNLEMMMILLMMI